MFLFKNIDIKKATGIDNLSVRILRLALPFTIIPILTILNQAIAEATFPKQWKTAIITPLHKGGDPNTLTNYRPISVLPILSKIYEKHILLTLQQHLEVNRTIHSSQSGFRKHHSCTTTLHHLYSTWLDMTKNKHPLVLLFLDFQKAFDVVDHQILLSKLAHIGIDGNLFKTIQSFLSGREQCVKIHSSYSDTLPVLTGVPQCSILAPTLFLMFINDLLTLPLNCTSHAYADDTTFFISCTDNQKIQSLLNHDLTIIQQWCDMNKMALNTTKSHYLLINPPKNCSLTIKLGRTQLKSRSSTKLLGYMVNDTLSWTDHVSYLSNKISSNLRLFYNIRHFMNFSTSKLYYYNYIHSYLIYGVHLYYPLSPTLRTNPLFILQKKALRLICRSNSNRSTPLKKNTINSIYCIKNSNFTAS